MLNFTFRRYRLLASSHYSGRVSDLRLSISDPQKLSLPRQEFYQGPRHRQRKIDGPNYDPPSSITQASLRRAIEAARKAGLFVTGIRPDGTLIVHESAHAIAGVAAVDETEALSKWEDVRV